MVLAGVLLYAPAVAVFALEQTVAQPLLALVVDESAAAAQPAVAGQAAVVPQLSAEAAVVLDAPVVVVPQLSAEVAVVLDAPVAVVPQLSAEVAVGLAERVVDVQQPSAVVVSVFRVAVARRECGAAVPPEAVVLSASHALD